MSRYIPVFQQYAPPRVYDLDELREHAGVLEVHLRSEDRRRLTFSFSAHLAFQKADEGDSLVTLNAIGSISELGRSFYRVEESDYIRWFVEQSYGIRSPESLTHIVITTIDDIIDVITLEMPSIVAL
jgi:hypothetical protein